MAFWDYSLGQATTDIFGLLKVKEETKAAIAVGQVQAEAAERVDAKAEARSASNFEQVKWLILVAIGGLVLYKVVSKARG